MTQTTLSQSDARLAMTSATRSTTTIRRTASVLVQCLIYDRVSTRLDISSTLNTASHWPRSTDEVDQQCRPN